MSQRKALAFVNGQRHLFGSDTTSVTPLPTSKPRKPKAPIAIARTEHQEQVLLCQWMDARQIKYFSVPNAARRSYKLANYLKQEGFKTGCCDLVLISQCLQNERSRPVAIELKNVKGGKLSDSQIEFLKLMQNNGWHAIVAHGFDDAVRQLTELGF